jgi:biopolymer transport protein ExbD/biopolymer transport protein TolR
MAMSGGTSGGALSEINVTPLIDVLLVLIIIFMVIQPTTPKGLNTLVPQPPKNKTNDQPNDRTIVVQVLANGASVNYKINDQSFAKDDIAPELTKIFETRVEKVMFIKGDRDLDFSSVADAVGFGKTAGVTNIAIITPQVEAGH